MFAESSKAFIFQKFAVKFYFGLSLHIFQLGSSLSLENVCNHWCMYQTEISSTAVVPQSKFTELCSSAAVVSQSKSTELCSSASVVSQSKSTEIWSSAAPFDHDLRYFRHRTNEHFNSVLFIRKNSPTVAPLSSHWNQHAWPNYWKNYWREPHTRSIEGFDRVSAKFEFRCESF